MFLAAFGLYLWCFQPGAAWGDGADFVLCSWFLGVPHPTGYPSYVLFGKLAALAPAGSAGLRVGLLSSFAGAVCVALFFLLAARLARGAAAGLYAAVLLGLSTFFWSGAVTVEVYALNLLFCVGIVSLFAKSRQDVRPAILFFLVGALGMGNHGTLVIPAVIVGLAALWVVIKRTGPVAGFLLAGLFTFLGLTTYLALPLFSARSALFDWNNPEFARNMRLLLSGYDFWVVGEYIPAQMLKNFMQLVESIGAQLTEFAVVAFFIGLLFAKNGMRRRVLLFIVFIVSALFPILYPTREKESFFLISFTLFLLFAAAGLRRAGDWIPGRTARRVVPAVILTLAAVHGIFLMSRNRHYLAERQNVTPRIYSDAVFESAPRDALIFMDHVADDTVFPPMYFHYLENSRRDTFLFYRLYMAFPWWMDAMRARAAELGAAVDIPVIDLIEEKNALYEVGAEEQERLAAGKTMNTVAIDIQTVKLLNSNRAAAPILINTPDRFNQSRLSAGYDFSPHGALFMLDAQPGAPMAPDLDAAAMMFDDAVFRALVWELHAERAGWRLHRAELAQQLRRHDEYKDNLRAVVGHLEAALQYKKDDCSTYKILVRAYAELGDPAMAREYANKHAECKRTEYDIR